MRRLRLHIHCFQHSSGISTGATRVIIRNQSHMASCNVSICQRAAIIYHIYIQMITDRLLMTVNQLFLDFISILLDVFFFSEGRRSYYKINRSNTCFFKFTGEFSARKYNILQALDFNTNKFIIKICYTTGISLQF